MCKDFITSARPLFCRMVLIIHMYYNVFQLHMLYIWAGSGQGLAPARGRLNCYMTVLYVL
jgi:hypothetical protein